MASNRDKRRYAFQSVYQFDALVPQGGEQASEQVESWLRETAGLAQPDREEIFSLAKAAFDARHIADAEFAALAPTWPAHRQPAVDRAILRLAHFELTRPGGIEKGRMIINDAIELTKEYSTDRSPSFVNGLLDKVFKRLGGTREKQSSKTGVTDKVAAAPASESPAVTELPGV